VSSSRGEPPALLLWWERLSTGVQGAIAFPVFFVLLVLLNWGPWNQPLWRSIIYGVIEGLPLTALLLWVTDSERRKRRDGAG
jgi:hypothetical protein